MKALLAGATGLVGGHVLDRLLARGDEVVAVGRRATGLATEDLVVDLAALPALPGADVAICALGTTIAAAGSREAFRALDHDAVLAFVRTAREAGARHAIVVTAVGADAGSGVFYNRVKGEVEQALEALDLDGLDLVQPGLLIGARSERRPVEALFQRLAPITNLMLPGPLDRYGAIEAETVARAVVALAASGPAGVRRHENRALRKLAG